MQIYEPCHTLSRISYKTVNTWMMSISKISAYTNFHDKVHKFKISGKVGF